MIYRIGKTLAIVILIAVGSMGSLKAKIKVYISADMEGVAGVVTDAQLGPSGFEYQRFRQFMTNEVLVAIETARAAGASEILVSDSHGNGQNLLIEQLPEDVQVVRSWPRPLMMMEGIDASFDAVIFIGYHSSTTNPEGVRAHTMSSANLAGVYLNCVPMSEAGFNAAIAGHFGVPVVMISGDDVIIEEAQKLLPDIAGAVVKEAISFHAAKVMTPQRANLVIRKAVERGLQNREKIEPYRLKGEITLDVTFKNYRPAELLSYLKGVKRTDAHSIRYVGEDMIEVAKFMEFILSYQPSLSP